MKQPLAADVRLALDVFPGAILLYRERKTPCGEMPPPDTGRQGPVTQLPIATTEGPSRGAHGRIIPRSDGRRFACSYPSVLPPICRPCFAELTRLVPEDLGAALYAKAQRKGFPTIVLRPGCTVLPGDAAWGLLTARGLLWGDYRAAQRALPFV